jgi:hypothetical protein
VLLPHVLADAQVRGHHGDPPVVASRLDGVALLVNRGTARVWCGGRGGARGWGGAHASPLLPCCNAEVRALCWLSQHELLGAAASTHEFVEHAVERA